MYTSTDTEKGKRNTNTYWENLIPIGMLLFMNPCSSSIKRLRDFILPTSIDSFSERVAFNYFPLNSILTFQNQRHFLIQKIVY